VADADYVRLAAAAMTVLAPGGTLLASTNHRGISGTRFRRILFDAGRAAGRELAQVKDLPPQSDYPVAPEAEPLLKSAWVSVV